MLHGIETYKLTTKNNTKFLEPYENRNVACFQTGSQAKQTHTENSSKWFKLASGLIYV